MSKAAAPAALDYILHRPTGATDGGTVAVLLHGRGSDKGDLQGLRTLLPEGWSVITPEAPFPGAPWGYGPGSAWYRYLEDDRVVVETLDESLSKLDQFLAQVPVLVGFRPGRLVLGGFSQGGTTSLAYALSRPDSVAAVLNFSGFLVSHAALDESGSRPPITPIYWGHGVGDPAIPIGLAEAGRSRLRKARAELVAENYRIGHWIAAEEVAAAVSMVEGLPDRGEAAAPSS
jgi:phospholipase/carboxylesterase